MDAYQNYINLNKTIFRHDNRARKKNGIVLVDLQTTDEFFASCVMRIASSVRNHYQCGLVVIGARKPSARVLNIVESHLPVEIMSITRVMLKGLAGNIWSIFKRFFKIRRGEHLADLVIDDIPVGKHIYDSLLRKMVLSGIDDLTFKQRIISMLELSYFYGVIRLINGTCIKQMVLPDNAYRGGVLFEIAKKNIIPSIVGIDLNGMSMHKYQNIEDYEHHCRTPDKNMIDAIEQDVEALKKAEDYLNTRISGSELQHDVMRAYSSEKRNMSRSELCRCYDIDKKKKIVLVASHVFCDAPHAYPGMLFRDYEDWLIKTCKRLADNDQIEIIVKEHPSAELYGEEGAVRRILHKHGVEQKVLSKDVNTRSLFDCVDVLVTCGGTAGMEFPCFGVPVVVAAKPPYYREKYIKYSESLDEYYRKLDNVHKYNRLSEQEIRRAKANLYVIQDVIKVRRDKLGLGSQAFYMGCKIDYNKHYSELCDGMQDGADSDALNKAMSEFIDGRYNNLVDHAKITSKL